MHDFIVVGSGCSGAIAASTLIEHGAHVALLDVGYQASDPIATQADFISLRTTNQDQFETFVGGQLEGIRPHTAGAPHLAPSRTHVMRDVERLIPVVSQSFMPVESLSYGGLGAAWGLGAFVYSDAELAACGLDPVAMRDAYQAVADQIGLSGAHDDAAEYTIGGLARVQPPVELGGNASRMYQKYVERRSSIRHAGFVLGRTPLALLTEPKGDREAYRYRDMDYYDDAGGSAYRPAQTIDALRRHERFRYVPRTLVTGFVEDSDGVEVEAVATDSGEAVRHRARNLILAAGPLGSARIILRSFERPADLPILCNPYHYMATLQPRLLGAHHRGRHVGLSQLSLFHDPRGDHLDVAVASLYAYRSLMLFRLASFVPLALRDALPLLRYIAPALVIAGIHQPDTFDGMRALRLVGAPDTPTGDQLHITFSRSEDARHSLKKRIDVFARGLRKLGAWPVRTIAPPEGASIHYAGTLPFSEADKPFTLAGSGRLHGCARTYVADASGFRFLPAKGPTLSLMANARLVAQRAALATR